MSSPRIRSWVYPRSALLVRMSAAGTEGTSNLYDGLSDENQSSHFSCRLIRPTLLALVAGASMRSTALTMCFRSGKLPPKGIDAFPMLVEKSLNVFLAVLDGAKRFRL